ncbi:hypothetical protein GCM10010492_67040 [Saccharothrix mutabilis subsp. mutabilis]|uniref:Uncharacterized protein n=1 Tax=Saccharothrix mutabilis subsp. mutabilis TaxID=66855 RepID=A0ABN0UNQ3_9PSEU
MKRGLTEHGETFKDLITRVRTLGSYETWLVAVNAENSLSRLSLTLVSGLNVEPDLVRTFNAALMYGSRLQEAFRRDLGLMEWDAQEREIQEVISDYASGRHAAPPTSSPPSDSTS